MDQRTISTSVTPEVNIEQVLGNLQVKGWERPEVVVKAHPEELSLEEQDDVIRLSCHGSCTIRLPYASTIRVEAIHGDARFKLLEDQLTVEQVLGSLALRNVGEVQVERIHGDLYAKNLAGDLTVDQISGNALVRNVEGQCLFESVGGNVDLRDVEGDVKINAGGNARVRLSQVTGDRYEVSCSGNIQCRVPEDASAQVSLSSSGQNIRIKLTGETKNIQGASHNLTMGEGDASIALAAGGNILLDTQESDGPEVDESESDFGDEFGGFPGDFGQHIAQQVESQIEAQMEALSRQLNEQMTNLSSAMGRAGLSDEDTEQILKRARESSERATARTQEKMRRAQEKLERKLEAARRRSEMKNQAADRRAQSRGRRSWNIEWPTPSPAPAREPVSDEERLMILRMLEQKKITLAEAEQLLAALEGKGS